MTSNRESWRKASGAVDITPAASKGNGWACAAAGCPMPGTIADVTTATEHRCCRFHFGVATHDAARITTLLRNRRELVQAELHARRTGQGNAACHALDASMRDASADAAPGAADSTAGGHAWMVEAARAAARRPGRAWAAKVVERWAQRDPALAVASCACALDALEITDPLRRAILGHAANAPAAQ